jgi:hypothetical protein
MEEFEAKILGTSIHLLDCGHMAHVEAGEELMKVLKNYL